jgi:opacity protein-like surface antigen
MVGNQVAFYNAHSTEYPFMLRVSALIICLLGTLIPYGAMAADGWEFMPFAGYRFGGSFDDEISGDNLDLDDQGNWGFTISSPRSSTIRYEFLYSHQETRLRETTHPEDAFDLDIHYLHLGGTVDVNQERFIPFFSGGIGMTYMSPGRSGFSDEIRLSLSLGGGVKWYPTDRLGIRFELRGYGTMMDTRGSLFCSGGCTLELSSDLLPQFETNLGLIFRF